MKIEFLSNSKQILYDFDFALNFNLKIFSLNLKNLNLEPFVENFDCVANLKFINDKKRLKIKIEQPFLLNISYALFRSIFYLVSYIKTKSSDEEENIDIIFETGKKKKKYEISYFIKNLTGLDLLIWTHDPHKSHLIKHNDLTAIDSEF